METKDSSLRQDHNPLEFRPLLLAALVALGAKSVFHFLTVDQLQFMILPVGYLVEIFTGLNGYYVPAYGFFIPEIKVVIDKSCAGYNWWVMAFSLGVFTFLINNKRNISVRSVFNLALITFMITICINANRILFSILLPLPEHWVLESWHLIQGVMVFAFYLILWYLAVYYYTQTRTVAKP